MTDGRHDRTLVDIVYGGHGEPAPDGTPDDGTCHGTYCDDCGCCMHCDGGYCDTFCVCPNVECGCSMELRL